MKSQSLTVPQTNRLTFVFNGHFWFMGFDQHGSPASNFPSRLQPVERGLLCRSTVDWAGLSSHRFANPEFVRFVVAKTLALLITSRLFKHLLKKNFKSRHSNNVHSEADN